MKDPNQTICILKASVADRSGALTSIASAFSNQGINLDAIVGYGAPENSDSHGSVVVAFHGTKDQQDIMIRRIQRLQKVDDVQWIKDAHQDLRQALHDLTTHLESC
jgi:acetolactate synthase small subunit